MAEKRIESEASLTFMEASSIIVGHGVGSGVLAVPYLASRNAWYDVVWVIAVCFLVNFLMHIMIAELSLNNGGAQFIKCFENELFTGKLKKAMTWICFALLGLSVLVNTAGFIAGASAVFTSWLGMGEIAAKILYYVLASVIVLYGMKLVGIAEEISIWAMVAVLGILLAAVLGGNPQPLPNRFVSSSNILALYSMVAFSLSAVMSVPQVVKGLNGDPVRIRKAIAAGTGINVAIIVLITFMTLAGAGSDISQDGALVDLASHLGGWVSAVGYIFSLLALSTSFWANTLNLRDIVHEQTGWGVRKSYVICSIPCFLLALTGVQNFVGFTRLAGVIQVMTGIGIILSYSRSRRRAKESPICGPLGSLPFQIVVIVSSVAATAGSLVKVL